MFYLISPLFLSLKQIEAVDNCSEAILEFDFSKKGNWTCILECSTDDSNVNKYILGE